MRRNYTEKTRHGVVLLIVLALLASFGIVALTYLLATGQARQSAEWNMEMEVTDAGLDTGESLLKEGEMQLLRGSVRGNLATHSLLEDMYGSSGVTGSVTSAALNNGWLFITASNVGASSIGRVLTISSGRAEGLSAVLVRYENGKAQALPVGYWSETNLPQSGDQCILNQRPFQHAHGDYDAADDHNVFLAARNPQTGNVVVPSFHSGGARTTSLADGRNVAVDNDGDGQMDSVWIDLGASVRSSADGHFYKPMYAFLVEDMDGRINVNTADDLERIKNTVGIASGSRDVNNRQYYNGTTPTNDEYNVSGFWGSGFGPAEITLRSVVTDENALSRLVSERYNTSVSGGDLDKSSPDDLTVLGGTLTSESNTVSFKGAWYNEYTPGSLTGVQRTPLDIRGMISYTVDVTGSPIYVNMVNPTGILTKRNPYDLNLGPVQGRGLSYQEKLNEMDNPYSPAELESVLRLCDPDQPYLPRRLYKRLFETNNALSSISGTPADRRFLVTTESWDVPVIRSQELNITDADYTTLNNYGTTNLAPETLAGIPLDLMRVAQFPDYSTVSAAEADRPRQALACYLYNLAQRLGMTFTSSEVTDQERARAQWAVNVVDFLDSDSVMTPFSYDGVNWVYGCERPELLLTETLALHSRNTEEDDIVGGKSGVRKAPAEGEPEDLTIYETDSEDNEKTPDAVKELIKKMDEDTRPDGKEDLDQRIRPQGAVYVELFNPWSNCDINSQQEPRPSDLWGAGGVELSKSSPGGESVWRLVFTTSNNDPDADGATLANARVVNFSNSNKADGMTAEKIFSASGTHAVAPGGFAVIGPDGDTILSFASDTGEDVSVARKITLSGDKLEVDGSDYSSKVRAKTLTTIPINVSGGARLSVTEDGSYPAADTSAGNCSENMIYSKPYDKPLDQGTSAPENDGVSLGYMLVHLQRLANPNRAYDAQQNPYRTVDTMPLDLITFNARSLKEEPAGAAEASARIGCEKAVVGSVILGSEKNEKGVSGYPCLLSAAEGTPLTAEQFRTRMRGECMVTSRSAPTTYANIWRQESWTGKSHTMPCQSGAANGSGIQTAPLGHTLGGALSRSDNKPYVMNTSAAEPYANFPNAPIPWLVWLNRPAVSPAELFLVPNRPSSLLLKEFMSTIRTTSTRKFYTSADNVTSSDYKRETMGYLAAPSEVMKILDYVRVPSPQTVTPALLNVNNDLNLPFAYYSMFREPGKINLNTIYDERVFQGLMNRPTYNQVQSPFNKMSLWTQFLKSRGSGDNVCTVTSPFRGVGQANIQNNSLFRENPDIAGTGLFENYSASAWNSTLYHPYFRYQQYFRMKNLTTTRSNVYVAWITVGLFETNSDGTLLTNGGRLIELGSDTGNLKRYRAYYMIDRSIPVGYVRGRDLNADKAVLMKKRIQ